MSAVFPSSTWLLTQPSSTNPTARHTWSESRKTVPQPCLSSLDPATYPNLGRVALTAFRLHFGGAARLWPLQEAWSALGASGVLPCDFGPVALNLESSEPRYVMMSLPAAPVTTATSRLLFEDLRRNLNPKQNPPNTEQSRPKNPQTRQR